MECVDMCTPDSFDVTIRAARLYAHLDAKGRWFEAPRTRYVIYGPPPSDDLADGSRDDQPSEPGAGARDVAPVLSAAPLLTPTKTPICVLSRPPCQFAGTACIFARATHRTEGKTRRNSQSRNNFSQPGFLFGAGDSLGYTSSPVLGMLAPCGARHVPEATVGHGFT
jgi:hypothetical protein